MNAFEELQQRLKELPGLGFRSAERIALHLVLERPERLPALVSALQGAASSARRCVVCGNLAESDRCAICADPRRNHRQVCVVEHVPDLMAMERSGAWNGAYHVLYGRLSPLHGVGPEDLNLESLLVRIRQGELDELTLALANDVEGEATCHYLTEQLPADGSVKATRIGFGLPSGGGILYADSNTLKSALEARRVFR